jgi:hypothetical protein
MTQLPTRALYTFGKMRYELFEKEKHDAEFKQSLVKETSPEAVSAWKKLFL